MNRSFAIGIWLMIGIIMLNPIAHLFKVARISYAVPAVIFYVGFPLTIILLIFGSLWQRGTMQRPPLLFLGTLLVMFVWSGLQYIIQGGAIADMLGNVLRLLFVATCLTTLCLFGPPFRNFINRHFDRFAKISVAVSAASTFAMHALGAVGFSVYYGLQVTAALFSLAYGLIRQKHAFTILSILALLGSGKRGGMLAGFAVFGAYLLVSVGRVSLHRIVVFTTLIFGLLIFLYSFDLLPAVIYNRLLFLTELSEVGIREVSSGRLEEVEAAMSTLHAHPILWVTGQGLGSSLFILGQEDSTVHFSPLNMIMIFGAPLTFFFYALLVGTLVRIYYHLRTPRATAQEAIFFCTAVAEVVFSLSAFTLLQSYLLWLSMAYLLSRPGIVPVRAPSEMALPHRMRVPHQMIPSNYQSKG